MVRLIVGLIIFLFVATVDFSAAQYARDALHKAASDGNVELVLEILRSNPPKELRDASGGTVLHAAVSQTNTLIITTIIKSGYNVNAVRAMDGNTPLHDAVYKNNLAAVKLLIENGADTNIKNLKRLTPVEIAERENKKDITEYFDSVGLDSK
ncbi:MAG: ankyrin repeat domain-containing protein [Clostridia bacterium]|nr:ankyrin repeat domain-containing protein [Clostridia bacterium]